MENKSQMSKMNFALVIHNHQPIENDDSVIETVYTKSYLPFLKCLFEFPQIKANLHYSGYLLEWLERKHPEFVTLLQKMVDRGQIEIMGGGYYEPILVAIPDKDAIGQISLLSEKIESLFSVRAKGLWMAERAWEPSSPEILALLGIKYTILDDTIFQLSGIPEQDCLFPYIVESRGLGVVVFPGLKKLRYLMPFEEPSKTISYFKRKKKEHLKGEGVKNGGGEEEEGEFTAVFADDGEKFGAWPTTYEEVYGRRWLRRFFNELLQNESWLSTITLSQWLSKTDVSRSIHLPSASYHELMEWSLPSFQGQPQEEKKKEVEFGARGFWRMFLSKYPESSQLYSKMLAVSRQVHHLEGHEKIKGQALKELWKGQYNDVYWHGIFGGLYFPKFRYVAYHHLITAQKLAESCVHRSAGNEKGWIEIRRNNHSARYEIANNSIVANTHSLGLTLHPYFGGSLSEISFKEAAINLNDVLARRYESYHDQIIALRRTKKKRLKQRPRKRITSIHEIIQGGEEGLENLLVYDRYPKFSFLDYIVAPDTTIDDFQGQKFTELANFAGRPYEILRDRGDGGINRRDDPCIVLSRTARATADETKKTFNIKKTFCIDPFESKFQVNYELKLQDRGRASQEEEAAKFATEINLGSLGDRSFEASLKKPSNLSGVSKLRFDYRTLNFSLVLDFGSKTPVWLVPIKTVSKTESGFESNLQGVTVIPNFDLTSDREFNVTISAENTKGK